MASKPRVSTTWDRDPAAQNRRTRLSGQATSEGLTFDVEYSRPNTCTPFTCTVTHGDRVVVETCERRPVGTLKRMVSELTSELVAPPERPSRRGEAEAHRADIIAEGGAASLEAIAIRMGLTRQRVHQILASGPVLSPYEVAEGNRLRAAGMRLPAVGCFLGRGKRALISSSIGGGRRHADQDLERRAIVAEVARRLGDADLDIEAAADLIQGFPGAIRRGQVAARDGLSDAAVAAEAGDRGEGVVTLIRLGIVG